MKITPNVNRGYRIYCIVVGVALCIVPFLLTVPTLCKVVVPILGVFSLGTGLSGW